MNFNKRTALITGAGSNRGFGRAVSLLLAKYGCDIIAADLNGEGAKKTAELVRAAGRKAIGLACDVSKPESVKEMVRAADAEFGRIDILINNAGVTQKIATADITMADWDRIFDINLRGTFLCSQAVFPIMIRNGYGRVVNVSSISGRNGGGVMAGSHYCAAKAGVIGLTRALGKEMAPKGINVNCVAPGPCHTDLSDTDFSPMAKDIPTRRIAETADVAAAMAFLASDDAGHITGVTINVNGGAYMG